MTIQVRVTPEGLALSGELDMASADDFREFASKALDHSRRVVLDVSDLVFVDSSGVKAILRLAEAECPHGLILFHPRDNVQRILDILAVEKIRGIGVERR
jgi:anti-anti-sigma factor